MEGVSDNGDYYSGEVADEPVKCPDKNELATCRDFAEVLLIFRQGGNNPILR